MARASSRTRQKTTEPARGALLRDAAAVSARVRLLAFTAAHTARGRSELAAVSAALETLVSAFAVLRARPRALEGGTADAIGFRDDTGSDPYETPDEGMDVDHDHGADAPESRARGELRRIGFR